MFCLCFKKSANIALSHLTVPCSSNNGLYNAELSFRSNLLFGQVNKKSRKTKLRAFAHTQQGPVSKSQLSKGSIFLS